MIRVFAPGCRPGADTEAQQWKQEDGPAAAAVPADAAALPPLPPPPIVAACRCGQTRVEARAAPLLLCVRALLWTAHSSCTGRVVDMQLTARRAPQHLRPPTTATAAAASSCQVCRLMLPDSWDAAMLATSVSLASNSIHSAYLSERGIVAPSCRRRLCTQRCFPRGKSGSVMPCHSQCQCRWSNAMLAPTPTCPRHGFCPVRLQLRVTAGEAQLSVYRKGASPRVTFRCGRCLVRVFRQQEAADGSVLGQASCACSTYLLCSAGVHHG